MRAFVDRWIASGWSGLLLAGSMGCGGLAEDGRKPIGSDEDEPELSTALVATEASTTVRIEPPAPNLSSERTTLPGSSRVGQACGPLGEESQSLVVGDVELQQDSRCGAGSACLMRAPVGSECRGNLSSGTGDCAADGFDLVPVPPRISAEPAWREDICTCRCDGSARDIQYCSCPSGMRCAPLIPSAGANAAARPYVGSYCVF